MSLWSVLKGRSPTRVLPKGCKVFLMEIFAGAAILSSMAMSLGLEVANPVDLTMDGSDLLNSAVRTSIEKEIAEKDPYVLTFSPVCGPWGPWSHLNMSKSSATKEKIIEGARSLWYPTLKWIAKVVKERLSRGRKVLVENPWPSELWETQPFRRLLDLELFDPQTREGISAGLDFMTGEMDFCTRNQLGF